MTDQVANLDSRHEGCDAGLLDNSEKQELPVCMGGVAILGCNNPEQCQRLYSERGANSEATPIVYKGKVLGVLIPLNMEELRQKLGKEAK